ncbi:WG repeat-containing protein [Pedobacter sp.]|uniref:WG repeat-containing protein n=1 Tax=Pedobacter sp. TaxID=1411316 RepID=UPI0031E44784
MKKILYISFVVSLLFSTCHAFAQQQFIPYRLGKLWGLADTNGIIKLTPVYDEIEDGGVKKRKSKEVIPFFITRKNKKYGLLIGSKTLLAPLYNRLIIDSLFITEYRKINDDPTVGGSRLIIRNLKGEVLFPDSIMQIEKVSSNTRLQHMVFQTRANNNRSGAFWYDPEKQVINQWLFKNIAHVFMYEHKGKLFATVYKTEKGGRTYFELPYNTVTQMYDVKQLSVMPEVGEGTDALYRGSSGYGGMDSGKGNNLMFEKKIISSPKGWSQVTMTLRYRENKTKYDTLVIDLKADTAYLSDYKSGRFGVYHTTDNYWTKATDTIYIYQNYLHYSYKGKKGVYVDGRVVPAVYDELIYFKASAKSKPYFLASKTSSTTNAVYWGVIDEQGVEILPIIYDQIIRPQASNAMWIIKKDNLYGVTDSEGKFIFPVRYDRINPSESFLSFDIVHKGKHGYLDMYKEKIEPKFPYPVSRKLSIGRYMVFELKDANGKVLGFADPKGFLYFKN